MTRNKNPNKGRARALRYVGAEVRKVAHRTGNAAETIGPLEEGVRVTGVTAGQFSAIDAMEHMANELGRSTCRISTWTTGIYDVHRAKEMRDNEQLAELRFLLDRGTFEKSPQFAGPLVDALGFDAFRCMSVHAKVIIVDGTRSSAVLRSSMNLNKNLRTEQFDIDVDPAVADFYRTWFDALWEESGRTRDNRAIMQAVFDRYLALDVPRPAEGPVEPGDLDGLRLDEGFLVEDRE